MRMIRRMAAVALFSAAFLPGCKTVHLPEPAPAKKDYNRQLPAGAPALRKITDPALIPDFRADFGADKSALLASLDNSIKYFNYPSSKRYFPIQGITHDRAKASVETFRDVYANAGSADAFQKQILDKFDVYESVGCDDMGTVLFTGYYTPIFDASLKPDAEYKWPLYSLPPDLEKGPDGECMGRKLPDGSIVPYYTRAEIDDGALKGHELVWLKDRFAAYVCTIQGSARLRLPDGKWFNAGYAGNNGFPYTSVGQLIVRDGLIPADKLSLSTMIAFFATNPQTMDKYLRTNPRYVFFREAEGNPAGSLGLPVTAMRTVATDKTIFPRGCLTFVVTTFPEIVSTEIVQSPYSAFALDQDTGGSIRAPGRCDIYVGVGDDAGRIAGSTLNEGKLYYLFLKD